MSIFGSPSTPKSPIFEAEDWLYFKEREHDEWLLKYCKMHGPFLHVYDSEETKRMGKPNLVLILDDHLSVHKCNYRIAWCGFTTLKQKGFGFGSYSKPHWTVLTRDGYLIVGTVEHVDPNGVPLKPKAFGRSAKRRNSRKNKASRTISVGMADELRCNGDGNASSKNLYAVMANREHDDIERVHRWDITKLQLTTSGSPEYVQSVGDGQTFISALSNPLSFLHSLSLSVSTRIVVEEEGAKVAQMRFGSKEEVVAFHRAFSSCRGSLDRHRQTFSQLTPEVVGVNKPMFPLMLKDTRYGHEYHFISLNCHGVDAWFGYLSPKPMEDALRPLVAALSVDESNLVDEDQVDEIYSFLSRDLEVEAMGTSLANDQAMMRIINLPIDKKLTMLHMNARSRTFQGVHYWICILRTPKEPERVLRLFLQHLNNQTAKKAKFLERFVENDGLDSLLSISRKLKRGAGVAVR